MRRVSISVFLAILLVLIFSSVDAQTNVLSNPGFEPPYSGGSLRSTASGWSPWIGGGSPDFYPEEFGSVYSGTRSQAILAGFDTFNAAVYQTVTSVPAGSQVQFTAYGSIFVNGSETAEATQSRMRIAIDPNGGTNPNDSDVVWSGELHIRNGRSLGSDSWTLGYSQLTVTATTTGPSVTVFLWGTQQWAATEHRQYWDNASLVVLQEGDGTSTDGGTGAATAVPPPPQSSFVKPQEPQADGSIIHTVVEGDTLFAMAVAYGVTPDTIRDLNPDIGEGRFLFLGQKILIQPPGASSPGGNLTGGDDDDEDAEPTEVSVAGVPTQPSVVGAPSGAAQGDVGTVCTEIFDDLNQNRFRDANEPLLANGSVSLVQNGAAVASMVTSANDSACFENVPIGNYFVVGTPPIDYGFTTDSTFAIVVSAGVPIIRFGAAEGLEPPQQAAPTQAPVATNTPIPTVPSGGSGSGAPGGDLESVGLIIFGLAGVMFVGGLTATVLMTGN